ncbi:MAG: 50S ribosomal protein L6 [Candidatus Aenigmarchaeota archaeon]|nr:50S ribosomal protein L6 [Candidatus Aenigmarchaeota archaeon]
MPEKKISIVDKADVKVDGRKLIVKGPLGELRKNFDDPRFLDVKMDVDNNQFIVSCGNKNRKINAMVGTIAAHARNMMKGVTEGYAYELRIIFKHFPINISAKDNEIQIKNFLGEKSVRTAQILGKTDVKIDKESVIVKGINKEDVGQTAANIELACKLRNRDRRIFQDGIFIFNKAK